MEITNVRLTVVQRRRIPYHESVTFQSGRECYSSCEKASHYLQMAVNSSCGVLSNSVLVYHSMYGHALISVPERLSGLNNRQTTSSRAHSSTCNGRTLEACRPHFRKRHEPTGSHRQDQLSRARCTHQQSDLEPKERLWTPASRRR